MDTAVGDEVLGNEVGIFVVETVGLAVTEGLGEELTLVGAAVGLLSCSEYPGLR